MSWAGLPTETLAEGARTIVTFKAPEGVFATATVVAGSPSEVTLRGQFGGRIQRAVKACL